MERMGTEYQIFNGKEYVSLRRFWNMEGKYKTEKAKNEELEEENKKLKDENDTLLREKATLREYCDELDSECDDLVVTKELLEGQLRELEEENKKLKERLDRKEELNKSYRKEIKEHKLYEEKLEHRIIEFEELLHGE